MTRINCIPVRELTDKHLLAEYRELPRISALVHKWAPLNIDWIGTDLADNVEYKLHDIPKSYRLGTGHVKFFYDKGEYLRRRFEDEIVPEMQTRGFTVNFTKYRTHPGGLNKDWQPDEDSMTINRKRIQDRLNGVKT